MLSSQTQLDWSVKKYKWNKTTVKTAWQHSNVQTNNKTHKVNVSLSLLKETQYTTNILMNLSYTPVQCLEVLVKYSVVKDWVYNTQTVLKHDGCRDSNWAKKSCTYMYTVANCIHLSPATQEKKWINFSLLHGQQNARLYKSCWSKTM